MAVLGLHGSNIVFITENESIGKPFAYEAGGYTPLRAIPTGIKSDASEISIAAASFSALATIVEGLRYKMATGRPAKLVC